MALTPTTVTATFLPVPGGIAPNGAVVFTPLAGDVTGADVVVPNLVVPAVRAGAMSVELYPGKYVVQVMLTGFPDPHSKLATVPVSATPVTLGSCYSATSPPT